MSDSSTYNQKDGRNYTNWQEEYYCKNSDCCYVYPDSYSAVVTHKFCPKCGRGGNGIYGRYGMRAVRHSWVWEKTNKR